MTLVQQRPGRRAAPAAPATPTGRIAIVVTSDRPAAQLRARVEATAGVTEVEIVEGDAILPADLAIVRLGPTECTAALERISAWSASTKILAVGPVALSSRALRLGANAYLSPRDLETELEGAIVAARDGRRHLGTSVVDAYLADGLLVAASVNRLSARELEVLCRAGRGESPARTASAIGVAPEAVTQYRLRARAKLGLATTTQLRVFAAANGLR